MKSILSLVLPIFASSPFVLFFSPIVFFFISLLPTCCRRRRRSSWIFFLSWVRVCSSFVPHQLRSFSFTLFSRHPSLPSLSRPPSSHRFLHFLTSPDVCVCLHFFSTTSLLVLKQLAPHFMAHIHAPRRLFVRYVGCAHLFFSHHHHQTGCSSRASVRINVSTRRLFVVLDVMGSICSNMMMILTYQGGYFLKGRREPLLCRGKREDNVHFPKVFLLPFPCFFFFFFFFLRKSELWDVGKTLMEMSFLWKEKHPKKSFLDANTYPSGGCIDPVKNLQTLQIVHMTSMPGLHTNTSRYTEAGPIINYLFKKKCKAFQRYLKMSFEFCCDISGTYKQKLVKDMRVVLSCSEPCFPPTSTQPTEWPCPIHKIQGSWSIMFSLVVLWVVQEVSVLFSGVVGSPGMWLVQADPRKLSLNFHGLKSPLQGDLGRFLQNKNKIQIKTKRVGVVNPTFLFGLVADNGPLFLCHHQKAALAVHCMKNLTKGWPNPPLAFSKIRLARLAAQCLEAWLVAATPKSLWRISFWIYDANLTGNFMKEKKVQVFSLQFLIFFFFMCNMFSGSKEPCRQGSAHSHLQKQWCRFSTGDDKGPFINRILICFFFGFFFFFFVIALCVLEIGKTFFKKRDRGGSKKKKVEMKITGVWLGTINNCQPYCQLVYLWGSLAKFFTGYKKFKLVGLLIHTSVITYTLTTSKTTCSNACMIKPRFDAQSLCKLHNDCAKTSLYANMWPLSKFLCILQPYKYSLTVEKSLTVFTEAVIISYLLITVNPSLQILPNLFIKPHSTTQYFPTPENNIEGATQSICKSIYIFKLLIHCKKILESLKLWVQIPLRPIKDHNIFYDHMLFSKHIYVFRINYKYGNPWKIQRFTCISLIIFHNKSKYLQITWNDQFTDIQCASKLNITIYLKYLIALELPKVRKIYLIALEIPKVVEISHFTKQYLREHLSPIFRSLLPDYY
ncbi:hypothetical protein VP01_2493g2 [Puccinia sorghi]|uniref:Uncharacterized protein n=1 Tax=Puccinia sorghi TaxID=27349 RepID=A0A0L6V5Y0_9BASI|nr:hypothetical protein VP01_2493g2 [Puccinia sorghi]